MARNENPGALAGAAGASEKIRNGSANIAQVCPWGNHAHVARELLRALAGGPADVDAWAALSVCIVEELRRAERVAVAWAALRALDVRDRAAVLDALEAVDFDAW